MALIRLIRQKLYALAGRTTEAEASEEEAADESYQWMATRAAQITPVQMRMARAGVGWSVRELAEKAGVTASTVTRIENGSGAKPSTIAAIRSTLESAGVEFIVEFGEGIGVKLRKAAPEAESIQPGQLKGDE